MAMEVETARTTMWRAAWLFDQGYAMREAAMAKLFASEVAQRVTWEAVQVFGGYGYITEFPVERFWRDARLMTITEGTSEIQLTIIARELGLEPAAIDLLDPAEGARSSDWMNGGHAGTIGGGCPSGRAPRLQSR